MSTEPKKYIIGLTGNIGTGKTVVRRMLERLGAYTIDADGLSHRAIARGAPGYEPVLSTFGKWITDANGDVDRAKLGSLVFRDQAALAELEKIIHPLVRQAVRMLIERATRPVIAIEAIKLLEGELRQLCDSVWVTIAPPALQIERLTGRRNMSREDALERVNAQGAQADKIAAADVVLRNSGSYDDLWVQVSEAWSKNVPARTPTDRTPGVRVAKSNGFSVTRGKPGDSETIARLINRLGHDAHQLTVDDVMRQFGEKAYMLLKQNRAFVGIAGWQVEDLMVLVTDIHLEPGIDMEVGIETLLGEIEDVACDLQCEALLAFPSGDLATHRAIWSQLGYEARPSQGLGVQE
jgi:dephospho-CoA kinase